MDTDRLLELGYPLMPVARPIPGNDKSGKAPISRNGCNDGTLDAVQIAAWNEEFPGCNWGVYCKDLFIIDVDGDEGKKNFKRLTERLGALPDSPLIITGSGGYHFYFRKPAHRKVSPKALKENGVILHIDIKTANSMVVAPGSTHFTGGVYREEKPLVPVENLPDVPEAWLDFIYPAKPAPKQNAVTTAEFTDLDYLSCKRWVDQVETSTEGDSGDAMLRVCNAIYWEWGFDRNDPLAREILDSYNVRVIHHDGTPYPWREDEIQHKIDSVFRDPPNSQKGFRRGNREGMNFPLNFTINNPSSEECGLVTKSFADVIVKPLEWLWDRRITIGELNVLCGQMGIGKSGLLQDWMARVTSGRDWPDGCECKRGRVLYFTSEESLVHKVVPHFRSWGGDDTLADFIVGTQVSKDRVGYFSLSDFFYLEQYAQKYSKTDTPLRLFVLDPLKGAMGDSDANSETKVRSLLQPIQDLAEKYKFAVIAIFHPRKDAGNLKNGKTDIAEFLAGSAAFGQAARNMFWCWQTKDKTLKCYNCKTNAEVPIKGFHFKYTESTTRRIKNGDGSAYDFCFGQIVYTELNAEDSAYDAFYRDQEDKQIEESEEKKKRGGQRKKNQEGQDACEWLKGFLCSGPKPLSWNGKSPEGIKPCGEADGFKYYQLDDARKKLGYVTFKKGGETYWSYPEDSEEEPKPKHSYGDDEQDYIDDID